MNEQNFLSEIVSRRRQQVERDRANCDPRAQAERAKISRAGQEKFRLRRALEASDRINIIAEFKRASPSRGFIRKDAEPQKVVSRYTDAGAAAISVLTEPEFFHGTLRDLEQAREVTSLPILRKDFVVDEFQIDQSALAGADAILLIVAALTNEELLRLRARAEDDLGLDALVEVHTAEEFRRALDGGATLIGVNNRNLRTLQTSLDTSLELAAFAPADAILVSESGIASFDQIDRLARCGYRGFLIGESLMRADDPAALIRSLRGVEAESSHV